MNVNRLNAGLPQQRTAPCHGMRRSCTRTHTHTHTNDNRQSSAPTSPLRFLHYTLFSSSLPTLPSMWFTDLLSIIFRLSLRHSPSLVLSHVCTSPYHNLAAEDSKSEPATGLNFKTTATSTHVGLHLHLSNYELVLPSQSFLITATQ
jgi:hypothetical protein